LINLSPLLIVSHLISCLHHQSSYQFPQIQMTINMNESASVAYTAVSLDEHVSVTTPVTRSVRVQVAAPMDMAAGFKFGAAYKGKRFSVTVVSLLVEVMCPVLKSCEMLGSRAV
jgi:hypothetical protein